MTAYKLLEKGFKNIKIIAEKFESTPSFNAGALIELVHSYEGEKLKEMNGLFKSTFLEYKKILEHNHFLFSKSVREVDYYFDYQLKGIGLWYLNEQGLVDIKKIKLKFKNNSNPLGILYHCKTYFVDPFIFMPDLLNYLKSNNVSVELGRKVLAFEELQSKFIFNCTGLGSQNLIKDGFNKLMPICGHAIYLNDEILGKLNYIILIKNVKNLTGVDLEGAFYFMPKLKGFIGGTFMKEYKGDDRELNEKMWKGILERAKLIFSGEGNEMLNKNIDYQNCVKTNINLKPKF